MLYVEYSSYLHMLPLFAIVKPLGFRQNISLLCELSSYEKNRIEYDLMISTVSRSYNRTLWSTMDCFTIKNVYTFIDIYTSSIFIPISYSSTSLSYS